MYSQYVLWGFGSAFLYLEKRPKPDLKLKMETKKYWNYMTESCAICNFSFCIRPFSCFDWRVWQKELDINEFYAVMKWPLLK